MGQKAAQKPKQPANAKQAPQDALAVGQFSVSPPAFALEPGQRQQVTVHFSALGTREYKEYFVIEYANKSQAGGPNFAVPEKALQAVYERVRQQREDFDPRQLAGYSPTNYALSAYSQVPGVKADCNELFEELQVVAQAEADPATMTGASQYAINANQVCLGAVRLGGQKSERIKLYNPFNVECVFAAVLTSAVENVSAQDIISQAVGDTCQKVMDFVKAQPTGSRPASSVGNKGAKTPPPAAKGGKGKDSALPDDANYWSLDKAVVKIPPHSSMYFTVTFKPELQLISQNRFIACSIDNWYRVQEQQQAAAAAGGKGGKADANAEKAIIQNL